MTIEIKDTDKFADIAVWSGEVFLHRTELRTLQSRGYSLFLRMANKLPFINSQPETHWTGLAEDEINLVNVGDGTDELSSNDSLLISEVNGIVPIGSPFRIGIFGVKKSTSTQEARSAHIIVESLHGKKFRESVVIKVGYKHLNKGDLMSPYVKYTTNNFTESDLHIVKKATELDLLYAANCLAQLYAKRLDPITTQIAT